MAARAFVPGVLKVVFEGLVSAEPIANLAYFTYTGTRPTDATAALIAQAMIAAFATGDGTHTAHSLMGDDTEYTGCEVTDLTDAAGGQGHYADTVVGTRGGVVLPASAAVVVSKQISQRYRGGHPRWYFPFGVQGDLDGTRNWQGAFVTAVGDFADGFVTGAQAINEAGCAISRLVSVSYKSGGAFRTSPLVSIVNDLVVKSRVCSQRRRLGKAGG